MPRNVSSTGRLNQPLALGGRPGCKPTSWGGVRSMPIQTFLVIVASGHSTVHERSTGASAVNVAFCSR